MKMGTFIALFVMCAYMSTVVRGHSYGADPMACDSMKPGHGATRRQTRATPFIIDTNLDGYVPCTTVGQRDCGVIVRIRARRLRLAIPFKGFMLQARSRSPDGQITYVGEYRYMNGQQVTPRNNVNQANGLRMAGQFGPNGGAGGPVALGQVGGPRFNQPGFNPNNPFGNQRGTMMGQSVINPNILVQRMQCVRGTGVTHTENSAKTGIQLLWNPPVGFNRPVQFVATVVQDYNTYWMGHRSRALRSRPGLRMVGGGVGNTARWFSGGATRASSGVVILITSLCSVFYFAVLR